MNTPLVIGIVVFILIALLLLKLIKKVVSLVFSLVGVAVILFIVLSVLMLVDRTELLEDLQSSNNLFVLRQDSKALVAYYSIPFEKANRSMMGLVTDKYILERSNSKLPLGFKKIKKIYTFHLQTFEDHEFSELQVGDTRYSKEELLRMWQFSDEEDKKAETFHAAVEELFLKDDPARNIISLSKEEKIDVYKKTIAFKGFNFI